MKEGLDRFSKQHPKHRMKLHGFQQFGFGAILVNTTKLVNSLSAIFESKSDVEWAVRESTSDGPNHKQLRNAIILNQLAEAITKLGVVEKVETLSIEGNSPKEFSFNYPIGVPKEILKFLNENKQQETLDWIGEGPIPDVSIDILVMNCLTAINAAIDKKNGTI